MLFPIEEEVCGWVALHGFETVEDRYGHYYAKIPTACAALEGSTCTIYHARPQMCREAGCLKEVL